jgi:DNA-binding winged helix-turn-helix (wHTH) protein
MSEQSSVTGYTFGEFRLAIRRLLLVSETAGAVPLATRAFDTLLSLVENAGTTLSKSEVMKAVWPDVRVEDNSVNQCVTAIRRALGERRHEHKFIVTEPGRAIASWRA